MKMATMQLTDKFYVDTYDKYVLHYIGQKPKIYDRYCDHSSDIFDEYVTDGMMYYEFRDANEVIFRLVLPAMKYKHTVRIEYHFDARTGNYTGCTRSCKRELTDLELWHQKILSDTYFGILENRGYLIREYKEV